MTDAVELAWLGWWVLEKGFDEPVLHFVVCFVVVGSICPMLVCLVVVGCDQVAPLEMGTGIVLECGVCEASVTPVLTGVKCFLSGSRSCVGG